MLSIMLLLEFMMAPLDGSLLMKPFIYGTNGCNKRELTILRSVANMHVHYRSGSLYGA
jgi:hypothetical protein